MRNFEHGARLRKIFDARASWKFFRLCRLDLNQGRSYEITSGSLKVCSNYSLLDQMINHSAPWSVEGL